MGPYVLEGVLGSGGMGRVYLARTRQGRRVAVKVIREDLAAESEFRQRFRREADAARKVARFCTAEVLDADTDGPRPYLVTEYLDGPTLGAAVNDTGPLAPADLERVAIAVAAALTAIHGAGLVHRDLKPGNVVLSSLGPRVIDFGIARALDSATVLTHDGSIGTPSFMAPEQALDETVTAAADIFAWGSLILFAANAQLPFGGGPTPSVLYRIVHTEPDLSGLHGGPLRAIVARAMRKNPAERPTARELFDLLIGLQSGAVAPFARVGESIPDPSERLVVATGPRGSRRGSKFPRLRTRVAAAVLLGVVAAVVGVAVTVLDDSPGTTAGGTPVRTETPSGTADTVSPETQQNPQDQTSQDRWRATLAGLDVTRAEAFEKGDEALLGRVYAAGSSALAEDTKTLREISGRGARATGLRYEVTALEIREEGADKVVLRITDRLLPYSFVALDGTVLAEQTGKPPQTRDVILVNTADGWRIAQLLYVTG